jgi:hypothetical protein
MYGYSLQYANLEDYKLRDRWYEQAIYLDKEKFVEYVNETMEDYIEEMEMTEEDKKQNLYQSSITLEELNELKNRDSIILYYSNTIGYMVICHEII